MIINNSYYVMTSNRMYPTCPVCNSWSWKEKIYVDKSVKYSCCLTCEYEVVFLDQMLYNEKMRKQSELVIL